MIFVCGLKKKVLTHDTKYPLFIYEKGMFEKWQKYYNGYVCCSYPPQNEVHNSDKIISNLGRLSPTNLHWYGRQQFTKL